MWFKTWLFDESKNSISVLHHRTTKLVSSYFVSCDKNIQTEKYANRLYMDLVCICILHIYKNRKKCPNAYVYAYIHSKNKCIIYKQCICICIYANISTTYLRDQIDIRSFGIWSMYSIIYIDIYCSKYRLHMHVFRFGSI